MFIEPVAFVDRRATISAMSGAMVWADCQALLGEACADLRPGELIHGEKFSLFEAMAAIEIMDPKMDAGMNKEGFTSAEEAIAAGSAPLDLTAPQLLDVMDKLLACEATWQSGHTLAQTVYTCLYLHVPERTAPNPILHAYCKAVRSTCHLVRTLVCVADIHEENEDFIGSTFGFPLELEEDGRCMTLLTGVEETLAKQLKAAKAGADKTSPSASTPLQDDPLLEESYCAALLQRVRFRKHLHQALAHLNKGPTYVKSMQAALQAIVTAAKELAMIRLSSEQLAKASETRPKTKTGPGNVVEKSGTQQVSRERNESEARSGVAQASDHSSDLSTPKGEQANGIHGEGINARVDESRTDHGTTSSRSVEASAKSSCRDKESEGVDCLADTLQSSKLVESKSSLDKGGSKPSRSLCPSPRNTPHSSERMPFTVHLPEGGATIAPKPTPSIAAGIVAGQPPIHTTDLRQGVTETPEASTASGCHALGFDEAVNRRLLASQPPRSMKLLTWKQTLDYFDRLLQHLAQVSHVSTAQTLPHLLLYVSDFSDRDPSIVARSRLFLHLFPEAYLVLGRVSLTEMVIDALHLPQGALRKDPGVLAFAVKAARATKQFLRFLCTNSARQRRKLARCLSEWEEVRKEAEAQDLKNEAVRTWASQQAEALGGNPWLDHVFTCWTEQQICRIITRHLCLGFPQTLYSQTELPVIFWYLARMFVTHSGLLHKESTYLLGTHKAQPAKGARKRAKEGTQRYVPSMDQYLVTVYGRMAWGMVQAFALLQRFNKLPEAASIFNTGFEAYLQRFVPFVAVQQPVAIPYEEYTSEQQYMLSPEYDLLSAALSAFEDAREMTVALFTELPNMGLPRATQARRADECRALEQVVQRNVVALKVLSHVGTATTHAVTCDFSHHHIFPVLVVKKVAPKSIGH